jgi:copper chaperone
MGYLLDFVYSILGESSIVHNHSEHNHGDMFLNHEAQLIIGIIFAVMILFSFYRKYLRRYFNNQDNELLANDFQKIMIEGMTCNHCVATVTNTALKISGIEEIDVRLDENSAYIKGNFSFEEFKRQIQDVGYTVKN